MQPPPIRSDELPRHLITGAILAGGRGARMGGQDKGLVELAGRPMVVHIMESVRPQVAGLMINANRNLDRYRGFGWPVVPDRLGDFPGPLAGIAAVLEQAATPLVLTVPCDGPRVPATLVLRLYKGLEPGRALSVVHDGERLQPLFALLRRELLPSVLEFLARGERRLQGWLAEQSVAIIDFSDEAEAFINVNTDAERLRVEKELHLAESQRNIAFR